MSMRFCLAVVAMLTGLALNPSTVKAQSEPPAAADSTPADDGTLPPVKVITNVEEPAKPAPKKASKKGPPTQATDAVVGPQAGTPTAAGSGSEGEPVGRGPTGIDGYIATGTSTATKTNTPLQNIPQSITIITKEQAEDQGSETLGEALQYVPGVTVSQGEGHRDQINIRGQVTTADFFIDGVRDDAEYFRDLYNIQAVEVLKGPSAMIFGRGGGGGVINRVTKKADGESVREVTVNTGMYDRKRTTLDVGQAITSDAAFRLNAMYEDSESFRDYFELERYGINPTVAFRPDDNTLLMLSYEYYSDDRTVDRGVPSRNGRPSTGPIETFFGNPDVSFADFKSHVATATLEHKTDFGLNIRNHTLVGDYDKLYQNIFASSAVSGAGNVTLGGYQDFTTRQTIINQTDLTYKLQMSPDIRHTLLAGVELGYQVTDNDRNEPSFDSPGSGITTITVPFSNPTSFRPVFFDRPTRRRHTDLELAGIYVQDQLEISEHLQVIGGLRFDRFDLAFRNGLNGQELESVDNVWSPRIGVVFKPFDALSFYVSSSRSFLPGAGDQFNVLDVTTATLEPEEFNNRELGFKWEVAPRLLFTGAIYLLERENQVVSSGPFAGTQVGETRTKGGELALTGYITEAWQVAAGYGHQVAEVVIGTPATTGKEVPSVPHNTYSLWNKYQFSRMWGAGLGVVHKTDYFAEVNNLVTIPAYTRVDGAVFLDLDENWSAQLNIENILDEEYFASAHNNNNISPGAPRSAYVTVKASF